MSLGADPTVTVLIAAYNEARHIAECLASLKAQTYRPIEILVLDDGSTDDTVAIARGTSGVDVATLPHGGKARALNAGAERAKGQVLFFLDADMTFAPAYVEQMVRPILDRRAAGTSHATERVANAENIWSACWQQRAGLPRDVRVRLDASALAAGSLVFRAVPRDAFLAVGGFDDTGFLDDQTLAPKLKARAMLVSEAVCSHYNAETLTEVFASGRWGGKSVALRHPGWGPLVSLAPPLAAWRAASAAIRTASPARFVYDLVYDTGVWVGAARWTLGLERHTGK